MAWIKTISYATAEGKLKRLYDRIKGADDNVDNIMLAHSLRPASLEGHMTLYKNVLHHADNELPKWLLETLGVYVSIMNGCAYCIDHHFEGLKRILQNDETANSIKAALERDSPEEIFEKKEAMLMFYARDLTQSPSALFDEDINDLRAEGWSDAEILEANQVISYFAYANRTVLGLGVNTEGDVLGLSPNKSDESDNWSHE